MKKSCFGVPGCFSSHSCNPSILWHVLMRMKKENECQMNLEWVWTVITFCNKIKEMLCSVGFGKGWQERTVCLWHTTQGAQLKTLPEKEAYNSQIKPKCSMPLPFCQKKKKNWRSVKMCLGLPFNGFFILDSKTRRQWGPPNLLSLSEIWVGGCQSGASLELRHWSTQSSFEQDIPLSTTKGKDLGSNMSCNSGVGWPPGGAVLLTLPERAVAPMQGSKCSPKKL
jgi:hypothetical protein